VGSAGWPASSRATRSPSPPAARAIAAAVNAHLWDEGAGFYFDLDADGQGFIPTVSYSGLIPLIAGIVPADRAERVLAALRDPQQLLSPYGVRSVSAQSVIYQPGYAKEGGVNSNWRGPVWVPINYLLVEALDRPHASMEGSGELQERRRARLAARPREVVDRAMHRWVWQESRAADVLRDRIDDVAAGRVSPYGLAQEIVSGLKEGDPVRALGAQIGKVTQQRGKPSSKGAG
jgi:hypothetical protein